MSDDPIEPANPEEDKADQPVIKRPNKVAVARVQAPVNEPSPEERRFDAFVIGVAEVVAQASPLAPFLTDLLEWMKRHRRLAALTNHIARQARMEPLAFNDATDVLRLWRVSLPLDRWRSEGLRFSYRTHYAVAGDFSVELLAEPTTLPADLDAVTAAYVMCERVLEAAFSNATVMVSVSRVLLTSSEDRALAILGALTSAAEELDEARPILSWRIERAKASWTLMPFAHKVSKTGRASSGARVLVTPLVNDYDMLPQDELAVARANQPLAAVYALRGHPRVSFVEEPKKFYRVVDASVVLTTVALNASPLHHDTASKNDLVIEMSLASIPLNDPRCLVSESFAVAVDDAAATIYAARLSAVEHRAVKLLLQRRVVLPAASATRLVEAMVPLESALQVEHAPALRGEFREASDQLIARFVLEGGAYSLLVLIEPLGAGVAVQPGRGPLQFSRTLDGARVYTARQPDHEKEVALKLWDKLGLTFIDEFAERALSVERALELLRRLRDLEHVRVEWPTAGAPRFASFGALSQLAVKQGKRTDWLDLDGYVRADGESVNLALVLDAVREQKKFVQIAPDRWLHIEDQLRGELQAFDAARAMTTHGGTRVGVALALEQLEKAGAEVDLGKDLRQLIAKLQNARDKEHRLPKGLGAELRPYQLQGFHWFMQLSDWGIGGVLADDMGLGKTVQAIALLLARNKLGAHLVVAPTSVCFNWIAEFGKFAPTLKVGLADQLRDESLDVVVVSYHWLVRNIEAIEAREFATVIFDEAQALKNPQAQRTMMARRVRAAQRFALSGTPIENRLGELWSLFRVVAPGLLGSEESFRDRFAAPIELHNDVEARAGLGRIIAPFVLRRKKEVVATELPSKTVIDVPVELGAEELALYQTLRVAKVEAVLVGKNALTAQQRSIALLAALTELRLAANHPRFADADTQLESSKLTELLRLVQSLKDNGHRALVFSQFTSFLSLVCEELTRAGVTFQYLDGSTPAAERGERIRAFESGEGDVFVLSLKAGGTGVNLTSADYVIILDPWWNPAVEDQAIGRSHRMGQTKPVTVYRLFSKQTIEEKIIAMQAGKRELAESVLENASSAPKSMTPDDLLALLKEV